MTTRDQYGAVRKDDCVRETTRVGHIGGALNSGSLAVLTKGDHMGAVIGSGVGVVGGSASSEDLARLVHDEDTAHGVVGVAGTGGDLVTIIDSAVPVHILAWASLED